MRGPCKRGEEKQTNRHRDEQHQQTDWQIEKERECVCMCQGFTCAPINSTEIGKTGNVSERTHPIKYKMNI